MSRNRIMMLSSVIFILLVGCQGGERCVEVIDGDTFKTQNGATIRLLGINAPEITDPGGDMAKDLLTLFILNRNVHLDKDITDQDDYGRLLRYLFVDGKFINAELVRLGYAETRFFPPDTLYLRLENSDSIMLTISA